MSCQGCAGAVRRLLTSMEGIQFFAKLIITCIFVFLISVGKFFSVYIKSRNFFFSFYVLFSGVESFDVDLQEQKVTVKGNVTPEVVFQTVSRSGKKTSFWEASEAEPVPEVAPDVAPGA